MFTRSRAVIAFSSELSWLGAIIVPRVPRSEIGNAEGTCKADVTNSHQTVKACSRLSAELISLKRELKALDE